MGMCGSLFISRQRGWREKLPGAAMADAAAPLDANAEAALGAQPRPSGRSKRELMPPPEPSRKEAAKAAARDIPLGNSAVLDQRRWRMASRASSISFGIAPWPLPPMEAANRGLGEAHAVAPSLRQRLRLHFADTVAFVRHTYGFDWGW